MRPSTLLIGALLFTGFHGSARAEDVVPAKAAPPAVARVVLLHDEELLRSESRGISVLQKKLTGTGGNKVLFRDGSTADKAIAAAWLAPQAPASPPRPPEDWTAVETVVVLQLLPPTGAKPNRVSAGIGGRLIFRASDPAPVYIERVEGKSGLAVDGDVLVDPPDGTVARIQLRRLPLDRATMSGSPAPPVAAPGRASFPEAI